MGEFANIPFEKFTIVLVLFGGIYSLVKGLLVPGYIYKAAIAERDAQTKITAEAVALTERVTKGWLPPQSGGRS